MGGVMQTHKEQVLEAIARHVIKAYNPSLLISPQAIPIEKLIGAHNLEIDYQYIRKNGRVLGETVFDDIVIPIYDKEKEEYSLISVKRGTILADASLLQPRMAGRLRFTLAHELSHWLIHQEIYTGTGENAAMTKKPLKSSEANAAIERQADRLACFLLMPAGQVKMAFHRSRSLADPATSLAQLFEVSRQAMDIRLRDLRLTH